MPNPIVLEVSLFGCFRQYCNTATLTLSARAGDTIADIKKQLEAVLVETNSTFHDHALLQVSALAYNQEILPSDTPLFQSGEIALLPPVCGG